MLLLFIINFIKQHFLYRVANFLRELFFTKIFFNLGKQTVLQKETEVSESL